MKPLQHAAVYRAAPNVMASNTIATAVYAALDTKTGKVLGKTAVRRTSQEFVGFLAQVVAECRLQQEIHIILDNLSVHKTQAVREFLAHHPQLRLHFTPRALG